MEIRKGIDIVNQITTKEDEEKKWVAVDDIILYLEHRRKFQGGYYDNLIRRLQSLSTSATQKEHNYD